MKTRPVSVLSAEKQEAVGAFLHYIQIYGPDAEEAATLAARWHERQTESMADGPPPVPPQLSTGDAEQRVTEQ